MIAFYILIILLSRCCGRSKIFLHLLFVDFIRCVSIWLPQWIMASTTASRVSPILRLLIWISFLNGSVVLHEIRTNLVIIDFDVNIIDRRCTCFRVVGVLPILTHAKFWRLLHFLGATRRIISYLLVLALSVCCFFGKIWIFVLYK